ncbi:hypothetical protein EJ02DRAFT_455533 [Clathrospora elynae]|uniref:Uncharacterized protein n=1 Tax=Clathrospora elynae TaxID=706981 RepID=A0A6A5SNE3_9PLEO|nr:hypothetical protein EJ02DRAFT_455533 [Clathrospora elynae]
MRPGHDFGVLGEAQQMRTPSGGSYVAFPGRQGVADANLEPLSCLIHLLARIRQIPMYLLISSLSGRKATPTAPCSQKGTSNQR